MLETAELLAQVRLVLAQKGSMAGRHVVVSAGPTREPLDPVRFISNRSTGRQGLAVAQAALDAGARVTLVAGPLSDPVPIGVDHVQVQTTQEMADAVLGAVGDADALFMVAAVADFRPNSTSDRKIKKTETDESWGMAIGLEKTLDILSAVKEQRDKTGFPRVALGFAAETHDAFEYGRQKLLRKGLNFIAVNDVLAEGAGFEVPTNRIVLLSSACFTSEHSHVHGGPVHATIRSRYRQWLTHKLASWIDQFGTSGCVGCGRCITWCPPAIDITEEVAAIRATSVAIPTPAAAAAPAAATDDQDES
jgi:phosphopantothenoylcysteine synthetase/decarboxylase